MPSLTHSIWWVGTRVGGGGGLNLPLPVSSTPASRTFYSRFPHLSVVLSSFLSHFYCKILRSAANFSQFLPVPATLGLPLPALSVPASCPFWTPSQRRRNKKKNRNVWIQKTNEDNNKLLGLFVAGSLTQEMLVRHSKRKLKLK